MVIVTTMMLVQDKAELKRSTCLQLQAFILASGRIEGCLSELSLARGADVPDMLAYLARLLAGLVNSIRSSEPKHC